MNFSFALMQNSESNSWVGKSNGTWTGLSGDLVYIRSDVAFAGWANSLHDHLA